VNAPRVANLELTRESNCEAKNNGLPSMAACSTSQMLSFTNLAE